MSEFWHALAYLTSMLLAFTVGLVVGYLANNVLNCEMWSNTRAASKASIPSETEHCYTTDTAEYPVLDFSGPSESASNTANRSGKAEVPTTRLSHH